MFDWIERRLEKRAIAKAMLRDEELLLQVIADGKTTRDEIFAEFESRNGYIPMSGNVLFGLAVSGQITSIEPTGIRLGTTAPEWAKVRAKQAA